MKTFDTIIIGAGAAGLMAGIQLSKRKKSVLIIDMGDKPARKVAVSGGGNCNFTNLRADYTRYFGQNPRFVMSALAQFSPINTVDWVKKHNIKYIEKEPGRFFCQEGADNVVQALINDIKPAQIKYKTNVIDIDKTEQGFIIKTDNGNFPAESVIIATGGLSYPHLGISNIGHKIAKKFGHKIEPVRPALNALKTNVFGAELAGISLPVYINIGKQKIQDDLLFTHFGIGGPASYRATLFDTNNINIDFAPNIDVFELLKKAKKTSGRKTLVGVLNEILPNKLARFFAATNTGNIADLRDEELKNIANNIKHFEITNAKPVGFQSAEVTSGGISTNKISSKTMESKLCPRLFFAGECLDITGDLGGFNLQWAFSSGFVAGLNA